MHAYSNGIESNRQPLETRVSTAALRRFFNQDSAGKEEAGEKNLILHVDSFQKKRFVKVSVKISTNHITGSSLNNLDHNFCSDVKYVDLM